MNVLGSIAAAAMYLVTPITLPAHMTADVNSLLSQRQPPLRGGTAVALSRRGSLAIVVDVHSRGERMTTTKLLVVRAGGSRVVLDVPPDTLLRPALQHYAFDLQYARDKGQSPPVARFSDVALAADGTPFVTIVYFFDGAWIGSDEAAFVWNGRTWRNALPNGLSVAPYTPYGLAIAAAESDTVVVYDAIDDAMPSADIEAIKADPNWHKDKVELAAGGLVRDLGFGRGSAVRGRYVVGYDDGKQAILAGEPPHRLTALEWTDGRERSLGPGIAYSVNDSGDTVGSDAPVVGGSGRPTLWHRGSAVALSRASGTACAIADDGTIVGDAGGRAFIVRAGDPRRRTERLDNLVKDRSWQITGALAIADNGRILAVGKRAAGALRILLLEPLGGVANSMPRTTRR